MVESIKDLRKICGSKKKQPLYMELVCMKISIYITKLLLYTKISADYVTISMILLLIAGSVFMAFGSLWMIFIGILLIHFTIILDNVNGEVARYQKEDGIIGTFLEQVYHNLAVPFIFFALSYGVFIKTNFYPIFIFGFLAAIFGKPVVLNSVKDAVVTERLSETKKGEKTKKIVIPGKSNIKGGATKTGKKLYGAYDIIREFWVYPANIVHITILALIELINVQQGFFPQYMLLSLYLMIYGTISALIQITAFIVNYKGKTAEHYYKELFERK
jgi:hypothetical protein